MDQAKIDPVLSSDEIFSITHRKRAVDQLRFLEEIGIPARRRHDNTICVLRADLLARQAAANEPEKRPQRKSTKQ